MKKIKIYQIDGEHYKIGAHGFVYRLSYYKEWRKTEITKKELLQMVKNEEAAQKRAKERTLKALAKKRENRLVAKAKREAKNLQQRM